MTELEVKTCFHFPFSFNYCTYTVCAFCISNGVQISLFSRVSLSITLPSWLLWQKVVKTPPFSVSCNQSRINSHSDWQHFPPPSCIQGRIQTPQTVSQTPTLTNQRDCQKHLVLFWGKVFSLFLVGLPLCLAAISDSPPALHCSFT